jgi:LPXTG-site transpeptidase (sortase) family protein
MSMLKNNPPVSGGFFLTYIPMHVTISFTMTRKSFLFHLGNLFLALSCLGFVFIFYPVLSSYITESTIQNTLEKRGLFITIPSINAQSPIIKEVDPWNESVYKKALQKGVAHAKGTALPGQSGTIFLFAHSSALPWEITRVNTAFFRLGKVKNGETVYIDENKIRRTYKIREIKEVWPNEVNYLINTKKDQLILQTCTPIGTSLKRLLVFAEEVDQ